MKSPTTAWKAVELNLAERMGQTSVESADTFFPDGNEYKMEFLCVVIWKLEKT